MLKNIAKNCGDPSVWLSELVGRRGEIQQAASNLISLKI